MLSKETCVWPEKEKKLKKSLFWNFVMDYRRIVFVRSVYDDVAVSFVGRQNDGSGILVHGSYLWRVLHLQRRSISCKTSKYVGSDSEGSFRVCWIFVLFTSEFFEIFRNKNSDFWLHPTTSWDPSPNTWNEHLGLGTSIFLVALCVPVLYRD